MSRNDRAFAICQARWDNMEHPDYYADEREPCDCMEHDCEECFNSVKTLFFVEKKSFHVARKDHNQNSSNERFKVKKGQKYHQHYYRWVYLDADGDKVVDTCIFRTPLN